MIITKSMGTVLSDTTITSRDPVALDVTAFPQFKVYGLCENFRRLPADVAESVSPTVASYGAGTAGGRITFKTNSDFVSIHVEPGFASPDTPANRALLTGFDMYSRDGKRNRFRGIFNPSQDGASTPLWIKEEDRKNYIESRLLTDGETREYTINLPLFTEIRKFYIILREGSLLEAARGYKHTTPIVFYGSSIVHGVGAGRPGSCYPSIISRLLDTDFINLGFGGAALAEPEIIDYITTLPMSVFVYDYDYNAPSPEFLQKTHYEGYRRFREKRPEVPVIMASKVDYYNTNMDLNEIRRQIIIESYNRGLAEGDKNLYFVDGSKIYDRRFRDEATEDNCHPNSLGYMYMATAFGKILKKLI